MKEPLLSIVIPTRNRQKYCIAAIKDILSYNDTSFELCIQDNSDDDSLADYIKHNICDKRLKYKYISKQLASIFNINDSLLLATGKYVILIGDDDTILSNIFDVVKWADSNGYDSICPKVLVDYYWPGVLPMYEGGVLMIPPILKKEIQIDLQKNLCNLFKRGLINYMQYDLPKIYHGLILRERLLEIEKKIGSFFCGLSPDISGCISLSTVVRKHIVIDYPITIAGACRMSSSSQSVNDEHRGDLQNAPHFYLRGNYEWNSLVPTYYSVETIWADTALNTALLLGRKDLISLFNFHRFAAYALLKNRMIFRYALKHTLNRDLENFYKCSVLDIIKLIYYLVYFIVRVGVKKIMFHKKIVVINGISSISEAVKYVKI